MEERTYDLTLFEKIIIFTILLVIPLLAIRGVTYEFATQKFAVFAFLFLLLFVGEGVRFIRKRSEMNLYLSLPHVWGLIFALSAIASSFNLLRFNKYYFPYSLEVAMYVLYLAIISIYFSNRIKSKKYMTYFMLALLISGFIVALDALYNFYTGKDWFLGGYGRPYNRGTMKATIGNPNFVSSHLGSLLPIALYFIISYDFGWKYEERKKKFFYWRIVAIKSFATASFILFMIVVMIAQTRSVYAGVFSAFVFFALGYGLYKLLRKGERRTDFERIGLVDKEFAKKILNLNSSFMMMIIILVAVFFVIYSTNNPLSGGKVSVLGRIEAIKTDKHSWDGRMLAWLSSIYQWKAHPIFGTGIGTYQIYTITYLGDVMKDHPEKLYAWNNFKRTHNDYLQVLGEMGLFGIISLIMIIVSLLILYFRMLFKQDDPDDALLLTLFASGLGVILVDSALSFPTHLMPGAMTAVLFASLGASRYFNKDLDFAWIYRLKKKGMIIVFVLVLIIAGLATTLKWSSFISEVMFRWGNVYYRRMLAYERAIRSGNEKLKEYEKLLQDLENETGKYSFLKEETYLNMKIAEFKRKNPNISKEKLEELKLKFLKERENEKKKIRDNIIKNIDGIRSQINKFRNLVYQNYFKSRSFFLDSLKYNRSYGKSYFYLAILMTRGERKNEFLDDLEKLKGEEKLEYLRKKFVTRDDVTKYIIDEVRDNPLKMSFELMEKIIRDGKDDIEKVIERFNPSEMFDVQMIQDGIDYFESSFYCFNEKNSYRILGKLNVNLRASLYKHRNTLIKLKKVYKDYSEDIDRAMEWVDKYINKAYKDFVKWYDETVRILPGNWNRFPDWEKIYFEYASIYVKISGLNFKTYGKLKEILKREVWACKWMKDSTWGIPDYNMKLMVDLIQTFFKRKNYQEVLTLLDDILKIYREPYEWNKESLDRLKKMGEKNKRFKNAYERARRFVQEYESLEKKRVEFMKNMINVYKNVIKLKDENTRKIYENDWEYNILTGENAKLKLEDVVKMLEERLTQLEKEER